MTAADTVTISRAEYEALTTGLQAASGFLMNAKIDLETGCPKRTAIKTIEGGLQVVRRALRAAGILEGGIGC